MWLPANFLSLCVFLLLSTFCVSCDASSLSPSPPLPSRLSLEGMDRVKAAGAHIWNDLVNNPQSRGEKSASCWELALTRFRALSAQCGSANEGTKTVLALTLTECHLKPRSAAFPSHTCGLEAIALPTEPSAIADTNSPGRDVLDGWVASKSQICLSALSESAFSVYVQFFNHIDNICFYLQSTAWQQRTEDTVNKLTATSEEVVSQLSEAQRQNELLLSQQKQALRHQHHLALESERLKEALDSGHDSLQVAFSNMREQVNVEQKRLLSGFHDVLALVARVVHIQQAIAGRLADVETVLLYIALVIVTFYITATDSTRCSRGPLYALWTGMLLVEIAIWRVARYAGFEFFDDLAVMRRIIRIWRLTCASAGIIYWFIVWWRFRDSTTIIVDVLQAGIQELKEHIELTLTPRLVSNNKTPMLLSSNSNDGQDTSSSSDDDGSESVHTDCDEDDSVSVVSETLSLSPSIALSSWSRTSSPPLHEVTARRNPPRASRPRAYRPPSTRHDVNELRLNPRLLFESSADFTNALIKDRRVPFDSVYGSDGASVRDTINEACAPEHVFTLNAIKSPNSRKTLGARFRCSTTPASSFRDTRKVLHIPSNCHPDNTLRRTAYAPYGTPLPSPLFNRYTNRKPSLCVSASNVKVSPTEQLPSPKRKSSQDDAAFHFTFADVAENWNSDTGSLPKTLLQRGSGTEPADLLYTATNKQQPQSRDTSPHTPALLPTPCRKQNQRHGRNRKTSKPLLLDCAVSGSNNENVTLVESLDQNSSRKTSTTPPRTMRRRNCASKTVTPFVSDMAATPRTDTRATRRTPKPVQATCSARRRASPAMKIRLDKSNLFFADGSILERSPECFPKKVLARRRTRKL